MTKNDYTGWGTAAIHGAGHQHADDAHHAPIYASSTFTFESAEAGSERFAGSDKNRVYSRWGNPGFLAASQTIEALESFGLTATDGGPLSVKALLHASGQAALTTLFLGNCQQGDAIVSHHALYGGTHELLHKVLAGTGISTILLDLHQPALLAETLAKNPQVKLVHLETPSNPTLRCVDIAAIAAIAHEHGVLVSVDNTAATPYLQQPFAHGADFVMHSTTKFLNGHGTAIGGVLLGKDLEKMNGPLWKWHVLLGGNSNPFDAFLLTMGLKTLELRMERHCHNAMDLAGWLDQHPAIEKVHYGGLHHHPDAAIVAQQMRHAGALMSFEIKGGLAAGRTFTNRLQLCTRAISFGTPDTLVSHPASMSHMGLSPAERAQFGITDGLIRLSVGLENIQDILQDFDQALGGL